MTPITRIKISHLVLQKKKNYGTNKHNSLLMLVGPTKQRTCKKIKGSLIISYYNQETAFDKEFVLLDLVVGDPRVWVLTLPLCARKLPILTHVYVSNIWTALLWVAAKYCPPELKQHSPQPLMLNSLLVRMSSHSKFINRSLSAKPTRICNPKVHKSIKFKIVTS